MTFRELVVDVHIIIRESLMPYGHWCMFGNRTLISTSGGLFTLCKRCTLRPRDEDTEHEDSPAITQNSIIGSMKMGFLNSAIPFNMAIVPNFFLSTL